MALKRTYSREFERLWCEYPNKSSKLKSYEAWNKKIDPEDRQELLDHIIERARYDQRWREGYIPMLVTFINQERWEDQYRRVPNSKPQYGSVSSLEDFAKRAGYDSFEDYCRAAPRKA